MEQILHSWFGIQAHYKTRYNGTNGDYTSNGSCLTDGDVQAHLNVSEKRLNSRRLED